jgi:hypothetical protein
VSAPVLEVKKQEERAAELVKRYKEYCIIPVVELFYGEDDGGNKTYEYTKKHGVPLLRTHEVLKQYASTGYADPYGGGGYRIRVVGVYATVDGIIVQFHKTVSNRYGPVKDYGWFMSLSSLLEVKKVPLEDVLSAVMKDLEEWERELSKKIARPVRSYRVDKPCGGYVIAFCPQCKRLLKPCEETLGEVLFVHEHQPAFIVLKGKRVECSNVQDQSLIDIVEMLWHSGERPKAIETLVGAWLLFKEQEEYENNVRAFFEQLARERERFRLPVVP